MELSKQEFGEQSARLGAEWKLLTKEQKTPFDELAVKDKQRYAEEMTEWAKTHPKEMEEQAKAKEKKDTNKGGKKRRAVKRQPMLYAAQPRFGVKGALSVDEERPLL